jgi:hypothetical protein
VFLELLGCHWIQSCVPENSEHSLHVSFAAGSSIVILGEKNQKENNQECNCPACKNACSNNTGGSSSSSLVVRQLEQISLAVVITVKFQSFKTISQTT